MELTHVIGERRSIRKFREDSIPDKTINELLNAARLAPSGSNLQPTRFVVVKSPSVRAELGACTPCKFITRAPVIFVCCADRRSLSTRDKRVGELVEAGAFNDIDMDPTDSKTYGNTQMNDSAVRAYLSMNAAIAIEHMVLRAVDFGLGSCWIGMFDRKKVRQILDIDNDIHIVTLLPVGYPDQSPPQRPRVPLDRLVLKTV
ncbi:MAG: nitroreductase family protein [Syntrophales bacterium]|jgi:nitroreductase|nr:nitroreductase family protein [Syntrophales bacterium]